MFQCPQYVALGHSLDEAIVLLFPFHKHVTYWVTLGPLGCDDDDMEGMAKEPHWCTQSDGRRFQCCEKKTLSC